VAAAGGVSGEAQGIKEVVNDLWLLCRDYAKQETIEPLKQLKQFLVWGLLGSALLCFGLGFGALSIIRALQVETGGHLSGSWNWVPYFVGLVFTAVAAALSYLTIKRPFRTKEAAA
jgi:hypothetical protein